MEDRDKIAGIIAGTASDGVTGNVGSEIASAVLNNLEAAGFAIVPKPEPVIEPTPFVEEPVAHTRAAPKHTARHR